VLALDTWDVVLTDLHEEAVGSGLTTILPLRADISAYLPVATGRADAGLLAMVLHMPGRAKPIGGPAERNPPRAPARRTAGHCGTPRV
jgi:hypothetical protein